MADAADEGREERVAWRDVGVIGRAGGITARRKHRDGETGESPQQRCQSAGAAASECRGGVNRHPIVMLDGAAFLEFQLF